MTLANERRHDISELLATAIRSMLKQAAAAEPPADPPQNAA